ncbi:hypothetical protein ACIDE9_08230 [Methylophilus sp. 'Pure River']|uniref:hypothetical protein n=1 Tax=Methylophilus sp. 'Pure River' TaxID=3377117 RepID=UPI00398E8642
MALIACEECKKEISDTAKVCPNCGYKNKASKLPYGSVILFLSVVAAAYFFVSFKFPLSGNSREAEKVVLQYLNDPDSAKIEDTHSGQDPSVTCGTVNAKNRMGAYTGKTPFVYDNKTKDVMFVQELAISDYEFRSLYDDIGKPGFEKTYFELKQKCVAPKEYYKKCLGIDEVYLAHPLCEHIDSTQFVAKIHEMYYKGY